MNLKKAEGFMKITSAFQALLTVVCCLPENAYSSSFINRLSVKIGNG